MKIYESKKGFYRIVKAIFTDRTEYIVEKKSKGKSTWGNPFKKDPYEWLPQYTYDDFNKAVKQVDWLIDYDKKDYEKEHPVEVSVL